MSDSTASTGPTTPPWRTPLTVLALAIAVGAFAWAFVAERTGGVSPLGTRGLLTSAAFLAAAYGVFLLIGIMSWRGLRRKCAKLHPLVFRVGVIGFGSVLGAATAVMQARDAAVSAPAGSTPAVAFLLALVNGAILAFPISLCAGYAFGRLLTAAVPQTQVER
ncbi:MAG: hypothetical protein JWM27_600 [Gemmatimonadetes bacterium]|nr:hypothetical protein [Gemmatimonadota bacterium]